MGAAPFSHPRVSRLGTRLLGACIVAALAAGCGGGGGTCAAVRHGAAAPTSPGTASVTFTMNWNSAPSRRRGAHRRYVPATARSVSVTVNGGLPQYLNAPASTITIDAPIGTDTFVFQTYDEQNGQGNVLSRATVTKAIVSARATPFRRCSTASWRARRSR